MKLKFHKKLKLKWYWMLCRNNLSILGNHMTECIFLCECVCVCVRAHLTVFISVFCMDFIIFFKFAEGILKAWLPYQKGEHAHRDIDDIPERTGTAPSTRRENDTNLSTQKERMFPRPQGTFTLTVYRSTRAVELPACHVREASAVRRCG